MPQNGVPPVSKAQPASKSLETRIDLKMRFEMIHQNFGREIAVTGATTAVVPRFQFLSLFSRNVKSFVFTADELKVGCSTAFTDGVRVFFNADFMEKILADDREAAAAIGAGRDFSPSANFLLAHELMHIYLRHFGRMQKESKDSPDLVNIAQDIFINRMLIGFNRRDIVPGKTLQIGVGLTSEYDEFQGMSEEQIFAVLHGRVQQAKENTQNQGQGQDKGQDSGQEQQSQGQSQGQGKDNGKSQGQGQGKEKPKSANDALSEAEATQGASIASQGALTLSDIISGMGLKAALGDEAEGRMEALAEALDAAKHEMAVEKLKDILKKSGYGKAVDALQLENESTSASNDEHIKSDLRNAIDGALSAQKNAEAMGAKPGGHLDQYCSEQIALLDAPKTSAKNLITSVIMDASGKRKLFSDDHPDMDLLSVYPEDLGLMDNIYRGTDYKASVKDYVVFVVDTSGSVSGGQMEKLLSYVMGFASNSDTSTDAPNIAIVCADTVLRGDPVALTEDTANEIIRNGSFSINGRGGTSMLSMFHGVLQDDFLEKLAQSDNSGMLSMGGKSHLAAIIYAGDLGDIPPREQDVLNLCEGKPMPAIIYLTTPDCFNKEFERAVCDYAYVTTVEEDELDLAIRHEHGDQSLSREY